MTPYNLLDLFSGIGGFSLGLERTGGFKTVAFCEIEPYPCQVLKKHWPEVPIYGDIRELTADRLAADGIAVDAICGGFPCQDISTAGKGAGIEGERSGLWREYARLIGELRPKYVFVENVSALLSRGLDRVLGDLASLGYDAEWHCIPASAVGAPHRRDRLWIVAYPMCRGRREGNLFRPRNDEQKIGEGWSALPVQSNPSSTFMAYSNSAQRQGKRLTKRILEEYAITRGHGWWEIEPDVGRVAYGVSAWSHRLKALGNAVVPQIPEMLGSAVLEWEASR